MLYALVGVTAQTIVNVDGIDYVKTSANTVELKDGKSIKGNCVIPSTVLYKDTSYKVTSIGRSAFYDCTGLWSLVVPTSVKSIGIAAFSGCSALTSLTLPQTIKVLENSVFHDCKSLISLVIPASVTSIGIDAFSGCTQLSSITIPSSVRSLEPYAFKGCAGLKEFIVESGNPQFYSLDGVLFNKDRATLLAFPTNKPTTEYVIPSDIMVIGFEAFSGCIGLISVTIPQSVTGIADNSFEGCSGLTSLTIPSSVFSIRSYAFKGCIGLKEIHCQKKEPQVIEEVYATNWAEEIKGVFDSVDKSSCKLYVPKGSLDVYSKAKGWSRFVTIVEE
jgi:hypothetical protein